MTFSARHRAADAAHFAIAAVAVLAVVALCVAALCVASARRAGAVGGAEGAGGAGGAGVAGVAGGSSDVDPGTYDRHHHEVPPGISALGPGDSVADPADVHAAHLEAAGGAGGVSGGSARVRGAGGAGGVSGGSARARGATPLVSRRAARARGRDGVLATGRLSAREERAARLFADWRPLAQTEVAAAKAPHKAPAPARAPAGRRDGHWSSAASWEALKRDPPALREYIRERSAVLENPTLDWSPVLAVLRPLLAEQREYIGVATLDADGVSVRLLAHEAAPAASARSRTLFASVPGELVEKYAARPALFMVHTHPDHSLCDPMPSSQDLSVAIHLGAATRFAAHVVVSRYGVIAYGLDHPGYRAIHAARDGHAAMLNLVHDVVASHEAVRSWAYYTVGDYVAFYPRHRLFIIMWPSVDLVADARRARFQWDLEAPIDHTLVAAHRADIAEHEGSRARPVLRALDAAADSFDRRAAGRVGARGAPAFTVDDRPPVGAWSRGLD